MMNVDEFLEHHGIKGMHWGIRNPQQQRKHNIRVAARADKKWQKNIYKTKGAIAVHNRAADLMNGPNGELNKINDSPKYKGKSPLNDPKLRDQYIRDTNAAFSNATVQAVHDIHGVSPSGKLEAHVVLDSDGDPQRIVVQQRLEHAATMVTIPDYIYEVNVSVDDGLITSSRSIQTSMGQDDMKRMTPNEFLEHHGVKGQKWGVRNDRTTTSITKMGRFSRKAKDVTVTQRPGRTLVTRGGSRQTASSDAVRTAATKQFAKRSTTDVLTDQQLREAINRMNMEQQYHQLVRKTNRNAARNRLISSLLKQHGATLVKTLAAPAAVA